MVESFSDRQKSYEDAYDTKIINRVPVIIRCDVRSAHRITRNLERPYCDKFLKIMGQTMLQSVMEMDGAVFAYHFSDEITFVLRNDRSIDDQPWFQNKIQKLGSVSASLNSVNFIKNFFLQDDQPDLDGDVVFDSKVFALPSITETLNHLILRQQNCLKDGISHAAQSELSKRFGKETALSLLYGKKTEEKLELLYDECDIEYDNYYPSSFRRGVACYKVPKLLKTKEGEVTKNKWILDETIPVFALDRNFLSNILYSGHDVFRADRDFINTE
jgi:tRNA(His) 5'-end guanylyltransferase